MTTATERAKRSLQKRLQAGWLDVRVILSPPAARALQRLTGGDGGMTRLAAIEAALLAASPPTPANDAEGFLRAATAAARPAPVRPRRGARRA